MPKPNCVAEAKQFKNLIIGHKIKQWNKFLKGPNNKAIVIRFLCEEWPGVTSSEPHCKNLAVLRHPQEINDMSLRSIQLTPHCPPGDCPFPYINCLTDSTPAS